MSNTNQSEPNQPDDPGPGGLDLDEAPFDKLKEECGVFAVYGHPEAANIAYLGLYALQHRGQESAGIASSRGHQIYCYRGMGRVAELFTPEVLGSLPGELAIPATPPPATRSC
jgi:amidophosphoribosyltransferase